MRVRVTSGAAVLLWMLYPLLSWGQLSPLLAAAGHAEAQGQTVDAYVAYERAALEAHTASEAGVARLGMARTLVQLGALTAADFQLQHIPARLPVADWQLGRLAVQAALLLERDESYKARQLTSRLLREARRMPALTPGQRAALSQLRAAAYALSAQPDSAVAVLQQAARQLRQAAAPEPPARAVLPATTMARLHLALGHAYLLLATQLREKRQATNHVSRLAIRHLDSARVAATADRRVPSEFAAIVWRRLAVARHTLLTEESSDAEIAQVEDAFRQAQLFEQGAAKRLGLAVLGVEVARQWEEPTDSEARLNALEAQFRPYVDSLSDAWRYLQEQLASVHRELFAATGDPRELHQFYTYAAQVSDHLAARRTLALRRGQQNVVDPFIINDSYAVMLEASALRFEASRSAQFLQRAFATAENAKAFRLLARLASNSDPAAVAATASLRQRWQQLATTQRRWEDLRQLALDYPAWRKRSPSLQHSADSAAATASAQQALLKQIQQAAPTLFAKELNGSRDLTIGAVQAQLPADGSAAAVEFVWQRALVEGQLRPVVYAFVIERKRSQLLRLKVPPTFSATIDSLGTALADPRTTHFIPLAARTYRLLLAPIVQACGPSVRDLRLAPDGPLWKIPFEALLTQPAAATSDLRMLPYVVQRYHLSYANSLTLQGYSREHPVGPPGSVLALAPFASRSDRSALPFTSTLLQQLERTVAGRYLLGTSATATAFRAQAADNAVLHLASHAVPNRTDPLAAHVKLADKGLTLAELLQLQLRPRLVVLSACQTNVGQVAQGSEGVTSLAWAFAGAGADNIVSTLWRVDDQATSNLLASFYRNLRGAQSTGVALTAAKRQALQQAGTTDEGHPFYWAGLVAVSDNRPVPLAAPSALVLGRLFVTDHWLGLLLGLGVGLLGIGWYRQRRPLGPG